MLSTRACGHRCPALHRRPARVTVRRRFSSDAGGRDFERTMSNIVIDILTTARVYGVLCGEQVEVLKLQVDWASTSEEQLAIVDRFMNGILDRLENLR